MPHTAPPNSSIPQGNRLCFTQAPFSWLYALWKFWRPHTVIGTSLSVVGIAAIVLAGLNPDYYLPAGLLVRLIGMAWAACLLGNLYIVGLNQLEDIAIDRINKPHLPLAAGEFSIVDGRWIVATAGLGAIAIAAVGGPWLLATVGLSLVIGTAYSLPPLRLKRFPFWASVCILAVRGAIVNLGLFLHVSDRMALSLTIPGRVWALTVFILLFSIAIAFFKDIPDIEGDRRYGISTLSVQLGQRTVFNLALGILTTCYLGMALVAPWLADINRLFLAGSHLLVLALLWWMSRRVPHTGQVIATPNNQVYPMFYQFIWKLFFLQYLIFPLACWLA
ncbi:homogentisate phytyltransferase [Nodosilinea sp. LEGE 07088]|uniref:homogentisate phytyltransferase n=1 Tax=Nodosilinea sp. LEGE 07088 TaxID=2777968 RepID=UPI00187F0F47|nr:homogentisate phytyltransferase [Nodosilinea sp. LEGE 07088]MBE9136887.1 homogentisate phytyltransferase [Nodosilinea sp. LEGE 07088]